MTGQRALDLSYAAATGREDFVVTPANRDAVALMAGWRRWPLGRMALVGPEGAGKTHLAHVFRGESGAEMIDAAALTEADAPRLVAVGAVVVENADRMDASVESALFHLMNLAVAEGAAVLVTGRAPPARWPIGLPDLASRLAALPVAELTPPDEALLAAVVAKLLADRGVGYEPGLPHWLALRIERSFTGVRAAVDRIDRAGLTRGRRLTRALARETLGDLS